MQANNSTFTLKVNYYEIYNEQFNDLLSKTPAMGLNLKVRSTPNQGVIVVNDNPYEVAGFEDFFEVLKIGNSRRQVAETNMNARSSRSHTILVIQYTQVNTDGSKKSAKLNLVDLAGSERLDKTGATG